MLTLVGPNPGDLAHVEGADTPHYPALLGRGWKPLEKLDARAIRALAPADCKLPPNALPATLAALVTAALLAGGVARPVEEPPQEPAELSDSLAELADRVDPAGLAGQDQHPCPDCDRSFKSPAGLGRHRATQHPKE